MEKAPLRLIQFRLALAFIIPLVSVIQPVGVHPVVVVLIVLGVLSDIFDGVIARKLNVVTDKIRKLDSNVDVLFTIGVLASAFLLRTRITDHIFEILTIVGLEAFTYLCYWLKFKKQPSNHSYLTKAFGVVLFVNFCLMIGWNNFFLLKALMVISILSYIDGFAILIKLKKWKPDNKSIFHL